MGTRVAFHFAAFRYLLSQTYTPEPDTKQRKSKECCAAVYQWLARAYRKGHDNQRKQWQTKTIIGVKKKANKIIEGLRTF